MDDAGEDRVLASADVVRAALHVHEADALVVALGSTLAPEAIPGLEEHGIDVTASKKKPYSMDRNLLHISFEGDVLEDPWAEAPEHMYVLSVAPEEAPDQPEYVEVDFEKGDAVAVNGERLSPAKLLAKLNELGGKHGIGRVDLMENRFVGMKSRGVYETPGGTILHFAHRQIESLTMDREVMHLRDSLVPRYATLVYNGFWYAPERLALQALITESQRNVTGTVRVKLYKGEAQRVEEWHREWFAPTLKRARLHAVSWEQALDWVACASLENGKALRAFYDRCLEFN